MGLINLDLCSDHHRGVELLQNTRGSGFHEIYFADGMGVQ